MPKLKVAPKLPLAIFGFLLSTAFFIGCGGGGGGTTGGGTSGTGSTGGTTGSNGSTGTNGTTGIAVSVTPSTLQIRAEDVEQFSASVSGTSNQNVIWSIQQGAAGGIIDATGFYQAPETAGSYTIIAASSADPSKIGTAQVTVIPGVTVTISPTEVTVPRNGTQQFTASVFNASNPAVVWDVYAQGNTDVGTITSTGLYTAPNNSGTFIVIVESVEDPLSGNDFAIVSVP